jgi:hypothetical protein
LPREKWNPNGGKAPEIGIGGCTADARFGGYYR